MKTIKSFLLGIFTLVLSIACLIYSVIILTDSTTLYYKHNQLEPTTFTTTFVVVSVILFALGLQLLLWSLASFKLFIQYHNQYLFDKRDRQIRTQLTDESYQQLYKELAKTNNINVKEVILRTFYKEQRGEHEPKDFADFIKSMINK